VGDDAPRDVTDLLRAWSRGDRSALDRLAPLVEAELHRIAHRYMRREPANHTLQTTALVNEAYLRLIHATEVEWEDRSHFFAISANLMRRILVDHARARGRLKRGGGATRVTLDGDQWPAPQPGADVIALDEALDDLARFDPQGARIVELRFFGGLTLEEIAGVIDRAPRTVKRDWAAAKVWLLGQLTR
jgi:RNA polymerase sigma factor (TIGR02999 family)